MPLNACAQAMWMMLQADTPDDYVVATNETVTVRSFVEKAFAVVGEKITYVWAVGCFYDCTSPYLPVRAVLYLRSWHGNGVDEVGKDQTGRKWSPFHRLHALARMVILHGFSTWFLRRYRCSRRSSVLPTDRSRSAAGQSG